MRSIKARLGFNLVFTLVALFLLQWFAVNYVVSHLLDEYVTIRLQHDEESLLAAIAENGQESLLLEKQLSDVYQRPFSGHYYHVKIDSTDIRSRSLWDKDLPMVDVPRGESRVIFSEGPLSQDLMIHIAAYEKFGRKIVIAVALDIRDAKEDMNQLLMVYATISILALLVLVVSQFLTLQRGFKPAELARIQLNAMTRGEIRKLDENAPPEIKPLVEEINHLVELLTQRISRSRNALGNLAHALKAPLTVMNQLANSPTVKDNRTLHQEFVTQLEAMRALMDRELKRARLAGSVEPGRRFSVDHDVSALISMFKTIYREKNLVFESIIPPPSDVYCPFDREDIMELLGNLLDNACKWARTTVAVSMSGCSQRFTMVIEDDGPGVPDGEAQALLARGVRVDEQVEGHGLGLAIVRDAVDHYGGVLQLGRSERLGGFRVSIELPSAR